MTDKEKMVLVPEWEYKKLKEENKLLEDTLATSRKYSEICVLGLVKKRDEEKAELLECLESIKKEFERLRNEAKSITDMLYLDGVLAVIDSRAGQLLNKHKTNSEVKGG